MKIVYKYDDNKNYIGTQRSFESPLEPGVYLMPANCTDVEPSLKEGYRNKWNGKSWDLELIPVDVYCYYSDGFQSKIVKSDYIVQDGEVIFDKIPTEEQLKVAFIKYADKKTEQIKKGLTDFVQRLLDSKANEKNYDSGVTCASYSNSTNEKFKTEANKFIAWRDSVWTTCYEVLAKVEVGEKYSSSWVDIIPTTDELKSVLPVLLWE